MKRLTFISGGSKGIGKTIVERLANRGDKVGFSYFNTPVSLDSYSCPQDNLFPVFMDVSKRSSIRKGLNNLSQSTKLPISILINNAGIAQEKCFQDISDDDWENMLKVNLQAPFMLCQEIIPAMQDARWGRIVNISSIGGQWGGLNQVHYAAAKAGLINLTRSLAKLYSHLNILTNAIAIGLVETDMSRAELQREDGVKKVQSIPLCRLGTKEEIANTAEFLTSDKCSYITGQTLNLNGGMFFN